MINKSSVSKLKLILLITLSVFIVFFIILKIIKYIACQITYTCPIGYLNLPI